MKTCSVESCERPHKGHGYCDPHYQRLLKHGDTLSSVPIRQRRDVNSVFLLCRICGLEKPDIEMTAASFVRKKGWTTSECKSCKRIRNPRSPVSQRKSWLRAAYGLSLEQYEELLARQDGVCAICKKGPRRNRLHVDHDHSCCPNAKTSCGKCIRGLLCVGCNSRLEWWIQTRDAILDYLSAR